MSAYVGGTHASGVWASAGDVLEMSVVRGVGGDRVIGGAQGLPDRCKSSTACMLCRLEPS